jgi:RimJ/RimL family protein N-acetyltransferase
MFAPPHIDGEEKIVRIPYAVHQLVEENGEKKSRFIGLISLRTLSAEELAEPPHDTHGSTATMLSLEIAYMYLPSSWGHGYATESISAVLDAVSRSPASLWAPYEKVKVRAIVHDENLPSQNVMKKCGMSEPEVLDFEGGRFFIAGKWRTRHRLFVFGREIDVAGNQ